MDTSYSSSRRKSKGVAPEWRGPLRLAAGTTRPSGEPGRGLRVRSELESGVPECGRAEHDLAHAVAAEMALEHIVSDPRRERGAEPACAGQQEDRLAHVPEPEQHVAVAARCAVAP